MGQRGEDEVLREVIETFAAYAHEFAQEGEVVAVTGAILLILHISNTNRNDHKVASFNNLMLKTRTRCK